MMTDRSRIPEIGEQVQRPTTRPPWEDGPPIVTGTVIDPGTLTRDELLAMVTGPAWPGKTATFIRWDDGRITTEAHWEQDGKYPPELPEDGTCATCGEPLPQDPGAYVIDCDYVAHRECALRQAGEER
jgi:hypothetical protein